MDSNKQQIYLPEGMLLSKAGNKVDRINELYSMFNKYDEHEIKVATTAKIIAITQFDFKIDLGNGIIGALTTEKMMLSNKRVFKIGDIVDVEVEDFDEDSQEFICERALRIRDAIKYEREHYLPGTIVTAKIVSRIGSGYYVDIGGGNSVLLRNEDIVRTNEKFPNNFFWFEIGQLIKVAIVSIDRFFNISYIKANSDYIFQIGNTVLVKLTGLNTEGIWCCSPMLDPTLTGEVLFKKQHYLYEVGDELPATVIGYRGGLKFSFL